MRTFILTLGVAGLLLPGAPLAGRAAAQPPVPQPFPSTNGPSASQPARQPPAQQPSTSAPAQQPAAPPPAAEQSNEAALVAKMGFPVYPTAQFLGTFDAGQGQKFYLFGSTAPYAALVQYYKSVLKQGGHQVFDPPVATYTFEVGDFDDDRMAFPPGVTIKDYQSQTSGGYPNPTPGGQPAAFPTVIQIVTPPAPSRDE
jgi:hypothetical protein